jgi:hypothetical protein
VSNDPTTRSYAAILAGYFFYNFLLSCKQGSMIGSVGPMSYFVLIGCVSHQFLRKRALEPAAEYAAEEIDGAAAEEYDYSDYGDFSEYGEISAEPAM